MVIAVALAACGNTEELHAAKHSVYDTDFAVVYTAAMGAVQKLYPNFQEDAARGVIQTSWHQVQYASNNGDDAASRGQYAGNPMSGGPAGGMANGATGSPGTGQMGSQGSLVSKRYFVRFDVSVVGGRPWRVHVVGHASEWEPGNAVPTELRGANVPHWLPGRTDELMVAIYQRLSTYAQPTQEAEPLPKADGERPIDTTLFGAIPADAAKAAAAVERAVERRDYAALRAAIADDVAWSLGADPGADAALATWQADPSTLDDLIASLKAGCAAADKKVTCPAKAAADGYVGWRVTLEPRGQAWKLTAFLKQE